MTREERIQAAIDAATDKWVEQYGRWNFPPKDEPKTTKQSKHRKVKHGRTPSFRIARAFRPGGKLS